MESTREREKIKSKDSEEVLLMYIAALNISTFTFTDFWILVLPHQSISYLFIEWRDGLIGTCKAL